jgi:hypothetical protein
MNENSDRTVLSGADGFFLVEALKPGQYQLTATKEGYGSSKGIRVEIAQEQSVPVNMTLLSLNAAKASSHSALFAASAPVNAGSVSSGTKVAPDSQAQSGIMSPDNAPLTGREKLLLDRIDRLEQRLAILEAKEPKGASQTPAGNNNTLGTGALVASLGPVAALPPASLGPVAALPAAKSVQSATTDSPQQPFETGKANPPRPTPPAPPQPVLPDALQAPEPAAPNSDNVYTWADFTWLNGTSRNKDTVLDTKYFTPEVRFDTNFMESFNQPKDHTLGGATESFRSGEVQIEQISVGGDFHWQNVRGRILTMDGLFATTTPRNDASAGVGEWDVRGAYKYVSEAYGGYHFNVNHGLNVDAGIFVSYIGLFSYYNFDNWTYQPSYVSSNTPWFFNGLRIQWFPTKKLKIEPWLINGWQSYNKYNGHMGLGGQLLYRPKEWVSMVFNQYGYGEDNLGLPKVERIHTDDSIEIRYYNNPKSNYIDKAAFSLTGDLGCQYGPGFRCTGGATKDSFAGWMMYQRIWWGHDKYGLTYGGGEMNNPGRYLTLLPPINGADAVSGSPYFTSNPGQRAKMWDTTLTFQWMPREYITWWAELGYRHSDVPYFTGRGGITPPGGNNGYPAAYACNSGAAAYNSISNSNLDLSDAQVFCSANGNGGVWYPDLRKSQAAASAGVMVKF